MSPQNASPALSGFKILVVDNEVQIRQLLGRALEAEGAHVLEAATGLQAVAVAMTERPAVIVLDLGLPDQPGLAVCRQIREWSESAIIVLTARHADSEKVALLDAGADDYVTKPFSTTELMARVRAHARRAASTARSTQQVIEIDGLRIDLRARVIERDGSIIHLTPTEWDLLKVLAGHAGLTLTHTQIFRAVWPTSAGDAQAYLRVHISNLRRKLERNQVRPELITTEPGVGYRFRALT